MIHIQCEQGSSEWLLNRYGIMTASNADKIITPAKWQPTSEGARNSFLNELIAERIALHDTKDVEDSLERSTRIDRILNRVKTEAMQYGNDMESRAVGAYEFLTGNATERVGLTLNDERTAGASLDRLVTGTKIGLELKCPFSLGVYVGYCFGKSVDQKFLPQLQWQLWISGLDAIEIYAFYPGRNETEPIRVGRDEEKIKVLAEQHAEMSARLEKRWNEFQEKLQ